METRKELAFDAAGDSTFDVQDWDDAWLVLTDAEAILELATSLHAGHWCSLGTIRVPAPGLTTMRVASLGSPVARVRIRVLVGEARCVRCNQPESLSINATA